jgi:hypothetical protein
MFPHIGRDDSTNRGSLSVIDLLVDRDPWIATTSGERLLFLLLRYHWDWRALADVLRSAEVSMARRFDSLTNFFVGASVLHLQQRVIRQAQDVRDLHPFDRQQQLVELRSRLSNVVGLTPLAYDSSFDELVEEILTSAEQLAATMSAALRNRVIANGPSDCHSCGNPFGLIPPRGTVALQATADHIWPRALGGDSIEANLIPACQFCNPAKGNTAAWQMAWIQPVVFSDADEANELRVLPREVKIALHIRAAMSYAQANGTTLKDAFLAIGPREDPVRIDDDQGYDFFNLRVHDPVLTDVNWMPN